MIPFFDTKERRDLLHSEIESWLGTPFHPNGAVKGHGVSCQKLVGALMNECGFVIGSIPDGPMDWHGGTTLIEAHLDCTLAGRFVNILGTSVGGGSPTGCADAPRSLQAGDIIGFWVGSSVKHVGVMFDAENFVHVMRHCHVTIAPLNDPTWGNRLARAWRPIE